MASKLPVVYIAAPWRKKALVKAYADDVLALGTYYVASQWPDEEDAPHYMVGNLKDADAQELALAYIPHIMATDIFIAIDNDSLIEPGGGRLFEFGMVMGKAMTLKRPLKVAMVGRPEMMFHALIEPQYRFSLWRECLEWLDAGAPRLGPEGITLVEEEEVVDDVCTTCK